MHIQLKNTKRSTLKYMPLVDCKSGHSPLLTAIYKFKYNVIKRTIIPYDIVNLKNVHFKKADRSKSLIADLKEFYKVNNLILDGRLFQASTLLSKKMKLIYQMHVGV